MKTQFPSLALAGAVALVAAASAQADFVSFTYTGASVTAAGTLDVTGGVATAGSVTVSGTASMDGTYQLFAGSGTSPSGAFYYDNLLDCDGAQHLTSWGLLFVSGALEINIWGNSSTSYSLYGWNGGYTPADDGGTFECAANEVPAPGAIALLGMAGLVGARRRRN